jgi:ribose 5-phosphate isomerase B
LQIVDKALINRGYKIALASDHAGVSLKTHLANLLSSRGKGHDVVDLGPYCPERVDYPDYAEKVCAAVMGKRVDRGILICGSGIGMSIAANRHQGIRCALVSDQLSAALSRQHNNSNVLALGARVIGEDQAWACVLTWLQTPFEAGRHLLRINKLDLQTSLNI